MRNFYITTPLYYVNDKPHLGTVYSTVIADILKRYHKLFKYNTFLLTGVDEHGQKCMQSAQKNKLDPQKYCDKMAKQFQNTWHKLNISYNHFFRTTSPQHKKLVQQALQKLYDKGLIYSADYEGWYCVSEETFYTSKDLIDGHSPTGKKVTRLQEKNYFFKMSAYQDKLIEHIEKNPNFIQPAYRKNEILSFLKKPLADLCCSRPKSRVEWGIELPFAPDFVTYVWIDALLNYITGIGWGSDNKHWDKWWNKAGAVHLIGKDILITHCVYWPCLLMALDIALPKQVLAHGWLLNSSQEKMSKSKGDIMDPLTLLQTISADSLRFFLARDIALGNDAPISLPFIVRRINEDLSNNLGNLQRRAMALLERHFNSTLPKPSPQPNALEQTLKNQGVETIKNVKKHVLNLQPHKAIEQIVHLLSFSNKYLEQTAPWKLVKTNQTKQAGLVLTNVLEILYISAILLKPVMPQQMTKLLSSFSNDNDENESGGDSNNDDNNDNDNDDDENENNNDNDLEKNNNLTEPKDNNYYYEKLNTFLQTKTCLKSGTQIKNIPPLFPKIKL